MFLRFWSFELYVASLAVKGMILKFMSIASLNILNDVSLGI